MPRRIDIKDANRVPEHRLRAGVHVARHRVAFVRVVVVGLAFVAGLPAPRPALTHAVTYAAEGSSDQDDMTVWVHPSDPSLSLVIVSDKTSGEVYVYDLAGTRLQTLVTGMPGNIDTRYGIQLGGECIDVVAFNERDERLIRVYKVNPEARRLERVDDGNIETGANYGFTLYRDEGGALYGITGSKVSGLLRQYLLFDNGDDEISATVTGWEFDESTVEGMVGDDETGFVYLAEEDVGIWRVSAMDDTDRTLIARVGDASGLTADVEGLTLYHAAGGQGYLIASSQGADRFTVFQRGPPHAPVGEFSFTGVGETDGIDVVSVPLDATFTRGMFLFHDALGCCPVRAARWEDIAAQVGLVIDLHAWDPRRACGPVLSATLSELSWTGAPQALAYDVVQGDLGLLRDTGGDFTVATAHCLADNMARATLPHTAHPAPGRGVWFLACGVTTGGQLTYDSFAVSQIGSRDLELDAAPGACP